jgi:hypothetical protein
MEKGKELRYFRNRIEVEGLEPERLWVENENGQLILVDEDEFALIDRSDDPRFYEVQLEG